MPRITTNLEIKATAAEGRGAALNLRNTSGECRVSVAGDWTGAIKVQYAFDDRDAGGWTDTSGGTITGTGAWLDQVETIPAFARKVAVLTTSDITQGDPELRCMLVYDTANFG